MGCASAWNDHENVGAATVPSKSASMLPWERASSGRRRFGDKVRAARGSPDATIAGSGRSSLPAWRDAGGGQGERPVPSVWRTQHMEIASMFGVRWLACSWAALTLAGGCSDDGV